MYLLVIAKPRSFMQDLKVSMQIWFTLHAWHVHSFSMEDLPDRLMHHDPLLLCTLSLPLLSQIFFLSRSDHVGNSSFHAWGMKLSLSIPNGLRSSELCLFYFNTAICPKLISDCTTPNVFAISPCKNLQICWSWRRWNWYLMELLIFNFFLFLHIWSGAQNWWK
jgi:hypothetical protein